MVAAQPVNVARERRPPSPDKDVGAAAHNRLDHAVEVGVDALEHSAVQIISEETNVPPKCSESNERKRK